MNTFYQVYGALTPPGSGGWFPMGEERYPTRQDAEIEMCRLRLECNGIQTDSTKIPMSQIALWAQKFTERDGVLYMEFN